MLFNLLPFGYFGPASWRTLLIVWAVAILVAGMFGCLIVYAANYP